MVVGKKIVIALPHHGAFPFPFVVSLFFLAQKNLIEFILECKSCYIDQARNLLFKEAQRLNADYLLFLDSDMSFDADSLEKMIALDKPIVTGVYYSKKAPHRPIVYKWNEDTSKGVHVNLVDIPETPFKVDSCGAGILLISKEVLSGYTKEVYEKYGNPFSFTEAEDSIDGESIKEDTSFCLRMRDLGYEIWADPTFTVGHVGESVVGEGHWDAYKKAITENKQDKVTSGIEGWTTDKELTVLSELAKDKNIIVEIGSWKGRSTKALLDSTPKGAVYAVDDFSGTGNDVTLALAKKEDIKKIFLKNVGNYPNLELLNMRSKEAAGLFEKNNIDMVFIDGEHSYESCAEDIDLWLPKVKKGGIICGHDYSSGFPGVLKVVNDKFNNFKIVDTLWYVEV